MTNISNNIFTGVHWDKDALESVNNVSKALLNLTELFKSQNIEIGSMISVSQQMPEEKESDDDWVRDAEPEEKEDIQTLLESTLDLLNESIDDLPEISSDDIHKKRKLKSILERIEILFRTNRHNKTGS